MKILTTSKLMRLNREAEQRRRTRTVSKDVMKQIDFDGRHVVHLHTLVDDGAFVRMFLWIKMEDSMEPHATTLDVPIADFNDLQAIG